LFGLFLVAVLGVGDHAKNEHSGEVRVVEGSIEHEKERSRHLIDIIEGEEEFNEQDFLYYLGEKAKEEITKKIQNEQDFKGFRKEIIELRSFYRKNGKYTKEDLIRIYQLLIKIEGEDKTPEEVWRIFQSEFVKLNKRLIRERKEYELDKKEFLRLLQEAGNPTFTLEGEGFNEREVFNNVELQLTDLLPSQLVKPDGVLGEELANRIHTRRILNGDLTAFKR
jgi:hypothetical protein